MASSRGVWGIDIGQCALKALRCTLADDGKTVIADAFDYVEYPKILSQPEADPEELIRDAIAQFLSRNKVRGDKVAISVSGQSGLARFIKLPPVEAKKIPDIVRYEARQQIPFPLEEVIWDFQQLAGGSEQEGFVLETEVGLFAMKRDQVFKAIRPFDRADVELDIIQLAPLSIYNVVCHDFLTNLPPPDQYNPENPPESVVVVSLGTDTTDLVVTNGYRVWQRNIPLGGNHFTRALTKDLKLTFAKAEHLKRHAREAEDPKKIFQSMRPVFNDLVTEVQRSISYFQSIDRQAKIGNVIALGNAMRLPGLQQYLAKNLGYDVIEVATYPRLSGQGVVGAPAFKENLLSYAVCYGLCLQGLNQGALSTNLLPRELVIQRMVREKKPWALATVAVLLLGLSVNFFSLNRAWRSVNVEDEQMKDALGAVTSVKTDDDRNTTEDTTLNSLAEYEKRLGEQVVDNAERRLQWPELLTAITTALPRNENVKDPNEIPRVTDLPLEARRVLYIQRVESEFFPDLAQWYSSEVQKKYQEDRRAALGLPPEPTEEEAAAATPPADAATPPANPDAAPAGAAPPATVAGAPAAAAEPPVAEGPKGPGWVIELSGYHDYNINGRNQGAQYVRESLLTNLENMSVELPVGPGRKELRKFTLKELGISHPLIVQDDGKPRIHQEKNPYFNAEGVNPDGAGEAAGGAQADDQKVPEYFEFERFNFIVQFAWSDPDQRTVSKRIEEQDRQQQSQESAAADGRIAAGGGR